ncbi:hypothetical protein ACQ4PT_002249 [Festuca glaucescens]
MEVVPVEDLEVEERSDQAEPPPPLGADAPHLQIPAPESGARLGFLLSVAPSRPASIAAPRSGLPPVGAVAGSGNTWKRGRQPSSDGDAHRQNKGKQKRGKEAAGDAQRHKEKSPWLSLFYEITTLFSGTDYVTANVFFPKICEIKMKIRQWATSTDLCIQEMSNNMIDKFDKYWTDIQGLMGIATLLDPRYKKHMLVACFAMLHGTASTSYECIEKVDSVVADLHRLIEEYELDGDEYQQEEECSLSEKPAHAIMSFFHDIVAQQKPAAARLQGEIENYLSDDLVPYTEKFNVLDWWKVAGTRYPTLRKVARDIFAIPITSVASESAFSISGRIVNEHRSRLTSHMLEVLMCYQDWLRNKYKDAHVGEQSFWSCLQDTQEEDSDLTFV